MYRIGVDVGGTFTDLVAVDDSGLTVLEKVPSTPEDPSIGVLDGLALLAAALGIDRAALLAQTERIVHGTTVATNALLERKGARVGLLTTEGHRDVIEMREGLKDDRYNLRMPPPEQLVARKMRLGVRERMRADGRVEIAARPCLARCRDRDAQTRAGRGDGGVLPARVARPRPRSRRAARRSNASCPAPMSRCRPRYWRRSRNSSGSRRQSSTLMSGRDCRAIWRGSTGALSKPAIAGRP